LFLDRDVDPAVEVRLDGLAGVMDVDGDRVGSGAGPGERVIDERHPVHGTERLGQHTRERTQPRTLARSQDDGAHVGCA